MTDYGIGFLDFYGYRYIIPNGMNKPINFFAEHPKAIAVECKPDYVLSVEFDNGERGELDMKPYLADGVFTELRDPTKFKTARAISFGAIAWCNGDIDLDPAFVYGKCKMHETVR